MVGTHLLSVKEMYRADMAAADSGIPSLQLMEAAGEGVSREIRKRWTIPRPVCVLCGPGNNGGDGFVIAHLLRNAGWPVRVALLGQPERLKGDAAANAERWDDKIENISGATTLDGCELVVDALFGAGLTRELDGAAHEIVTAINTRGLACVSVDIPSGVHGDTGEILGTAPRADLTVSFFRPKPGHFLLPGRELVGPLSIVDIGIPEDVLDSIAPQTLLNRPELWIDRFPAPGPESNKYTRGHAVIAAGAEMTGAARLAALGARRIGAGLVGIASPTAAFGIYASSSPGTLVKPIESNESFSDYIADKRKNAILVGPGTGLTEDTRTKALSSLETGKSVVIDADALSVFADAPDALFSAIKGPCVLTPHEGEFARLFDLSGDKLGRARMAAKRSGAVVLLKGSDTVIASPDGLAAIDNSGTPELSTGGSGDVLAGAILGLLAQGMSPFFAACAATWIHGKSARTFGPGLIAEDLIDMMPSVLREIRDRSPSPEGSSARH
ncbi:MAG: NAD(P)H-hydrate dehydratase [Rhodospirillales bacterium]|nr:NAD(P)H-hydrate dehydratase [Rhodospirillales bacterium]